ELPRIIGLKDAAGGVSRPARVRPLVGAKFRLLCGDDGLALPYLAQGGDGCISVTSNVAPGLCRNMFLAWKHGQSVRAQRLAQLVAELTAVRNQSCSGKACPGAARSYVANRPF